MLAAACAAAFIAILAVAAYWDSSIRVLHAFEALPYAATAVLCLRQRKLGYVLGAASGGFWLWMAGTLTSFVRNGFERAAMLLRTGSVDRLDILIGAPAACFTGALVIFSLWGYSRAPNTSWRDAALFVVALLVVAAFYLAIFAAFAPQYLGMFRPRRSLRVPQRIGACLRGILRHPMTGAARVEFGDFQTPPALARQVVELLRSRGVNPRSILEPTCGLGAFVEASLSGFPHAAVVALDVNADYVARTARLERLPSARHRLRCRVANAFTEDWHGTIRSLPGPVLIIGNPPWVTAAGLGAIGGTNTPAKSNFQHRRGLDALTGKSNFDVAEWMLLAMLEAGAAARRDIVVAMLVKTSVARRVLARLWATSAPIAHAAMYRFDAVAHFGVRADACLFYCAVGATPSTECAVGRLDDQSLMPGRIGWRDGSLVSDAAAYDRHRALLAGRAEPEFRWRSGVKHDCSPIMELERRGRDGFVNGLGERVHLESEYVYPLLKSTDVARGRCAEVRKWLLIPQRRTGDDTSAIAARAPRTWAYLRAHGSRLDDRRSSIYRDRPRFSVFGVGPYTFQPWKVAISGLHKTLTFRVVGPVDARPVVFDDACYHLAFDTREAATRAAALLDDERRRELLNALIFWDAKRPITADVLGRLDLTQVAIDRAP